jgi:hypothetical protein
LPSLFKDGARNLIPTQSITITGLGTAHFKRAVKGLDCIHRFLLTKYQNLLPLQKEEFEGDPALTFENKLVTPHKIISNNTPRRPLGSLDPAGIWARFLNGRGGYIDDNAVSYQRIEEKLVNFLVYLVKRL